MISLRRSTAIPGLEAKPIIDMAVAIRRLEDGDRDLYTQGKAEFIERALRIAEDEDNETT